MFTSICGLKHSKLRKAKDVLYQKQVLIPQCHSLLTAMHLSPPHKKMCLTVRHISAGFCIGNPFSVLDLQNALSAGHTGNSPVVWRGHISAPCASAPHSHCGGRGFESLRVHQRSTAILIQWVSRLRCFLFAQKP